MELKIIYMQFTRQLTSEIEKKWDSNKIILLIGPRQSGKTTLIRKLLSDKPYLFLDGDDLAIQELLAKANTEQLKALCGSHITIFIDEAQRIERIALSLKIMIDQFENLNIIVSGSSALELNALLQEPLTGRKWTFHLFPLTWQEYEAGVGYLKAEQTLEQRLVLGMYPEIVTEELHSADLLSELVNSYLFKDILAFSGIRKPDGLEKVIKYLAWQIGQEVSYSELSGNLGLDVKTVSNYVDLLGKMYVVFKLPAFSKNHRNEIKTNKKIYFYDNGVRNALIGDLKPFSLRQDKGALWENFLISERIKQNSYFRKKVGSYFWRTKQQQEIDYIEESDEGLFAAEIKWSEKKRIHFSETFTKNYAAEFLGVNRENFRAFIIKPSVKK